MAYNYQRHRNPPSMSLNGEHIVLLLVTSALLLLVFFLLLKAANGLQLNILLIYGKNPLCSLKTHPFYS